MGSQHRSCQETLHPKGAYQTYGNSRPSEKQRRGLRNALLAIQIVRVDGNGRRSLLQTRKRSKAAGVTVREDVAVAPEAEPEPDVSAHTTQLLGLLNSPGCYLVNDAQRVIRLVPPQQVEAILGVGVAAVDDLGWQARVRGAARQIGGVTPAQEEGHARHGVVFGKHADPKVGNVNAFLNLARIICERRGQRQREGDDFREHVERASMMR
jgi:hypothetical protein